jgi:hypothetical protein
MEATKTLACLGALAACLSAPRFALAEDNCSGYFVHVGSTAVKLSNDPNLPSHMSVGTCNSPTAPLVCTYKDKDADVWTEQMAFPGAGSNGTWWWVSGTGKYANAKWSGWNQIVRAELARPEGNVWIGVWGGNCK